MIDSRLTSDIRKAVPDAGVRTRWLRLRRQPGRDATGVAYGAKVGNGLLSALSKTREGQPCPIFGIDHP
jgi:hypothetical protein